MTAPTRFRRGVLGEGFDSYTLTSTVVKRAVGEGASPALPCGIGLGSATPAEAAATTAGQGQRAYPRLAAGEQG